MSELSNNKMQQITTFQALPTTTQTLQSQIDALQSLLPGTATLPWIHSCLARSKRIQQVEFKDLQTRIYKMLAGGFYLIQMC